MNKNTPVKIYDTTLRDGTQGEGISFSVTDKLLIAQRLDQFGVDYIEGGFPGSNPRDIAFFAEAGKLRLKHARLAAFGVHPPRGRQGVRRPADPGAPRQRHAGGDASSARPGCFTSGRCCALRPEENLAMIEDSVRFLVSRRAAR